MPCPWAPGSASANPVTQTRVLLAVAPSPGTGTPSRSGISPGPCSATGSPDTASPEAIRASGDPSPVYGRPSRSVSRAASLHSRTPMGSRTGRSPASSSAVVLA